MCWPALIHAEEQAREEGEAPDTEANKYMPCLLAACASGVPKVVTTALDAIVKVRRRRWSVAWHRNSMLFHDNDIQVVWFRARW